MRILAFSALLATSIAPVALAQQANVVHFQGEVTNKTCNISLNGEPGSTIVTMPTVAAANLATTGTTAGDTPFTLEFSNCVGTLVNATIWFAGQNFNADGRLLNEGTAGNLTIQVTDVLSNSIINFNSPTASKSSTVDLTTGSATVPFVAKYYAETAVSAGTVLATTNYSVTYE